MTTKRQVAIPAAITAAIPQELHLPIFRADNPCESKAYRPGVDPGCWVVTALCGRFGFAWGCSEESLADAAAKCAKAGGKVTGTSKKKLPALVIKWQPRESWERHAEIYPETADKVGPPMVGEDGCIYSWGSPSPATLYTPRQ
jgi:hypothetical protein